MKTSAPHHIALSQWVKLVATDSSLFSKRKVLREYISHNLAAGQANYNSFHTAYWAARQVDFVRSAYDCARDGFKASFSVYRGVHTTSTNPLHFANR